MEQTTEQRAWQCGHDTGLKDARAALEGRTIGLARARTALGVPQAVRAAFLNGYGHGIAEAAEPHCNHDAPAVRDGVCECGAPVASRSDR